MAPRRFVEAIVVLESPHPLIPSPSGEGTGGVFYVRFDWLWSLAMAPRRFVEAIVVLEPPHPLIPSPAGEGTGGVYYAASLRNSRRQAFEPDRLWCLAMALRFGVACVVFAPIRRVIAYLLGDGSRRRA